MKIETPCKNKIIKITSETLLENICSNDVVLKPGKYSITIGFNSNINREEAYIEKVD